MSTNALLASTTYQVLDAAVLSVEREDALQAVLDLAREDNNIPGGSALSAYPIYLEDGNIDYVVNVYLPDNTTAQYLYTTDTQRNC